MRQAPGGLPEVLAALEGICSHPRQLLHLTFRASVGSGSWVTGFSSFLHKALKTLFICKNLFHFMLSVLMFLKCHRSRMTWCGWQGVGGLKKHGPYLEL